MIQACIFNNGGFVLHKVELPGCKGHFSAWYSKDRTLLDAEQIRQRKRAGVIWSTPFGVRKHGPTWKRLQEVGRKVIIASEQK